MSLALHAAAAGLLAARLAQDVPEAPAPVRVVLLPAPPAPGPPAATPPASPAVEKPPAPTPRPARAPVPRPRPQTVARSAPALEPAPVAEAAATEGVASPGPVASAPPSGAHGAAGSGIGAGSDELAAYVALVRERLAAHKRYPALARRRGIEGSVLVRLAIAGDGRLAEVRAVGSAPDLLARSAVDAARRASPLPPPPRGPVRIEVPMRFRISD